MIDAPAVGSRQRVELERAATGGAVGRTTSGMVVFARHGLPGESVDVEITGTSRTFARGDVIGVITASEDRVTAPCPYAHAGGCGGCDLQHATPDAQREWKADVAREHLARIAKVAWRVEVEPVASPAQGSRTRLRCAVDEHGRLGLRQSRRHDIVEIDACWLTDPSLLDAFGTTWTNAVEVELRAIGSLAPFAVKRRPREANSDETVYETTTLSGEPLGDAYSQVSVAGHTYRVSPLAFWQSHRRAPELLVEQVMTFAQLEEGDRAVDLYSGVGLFSVPMAKAVGPRGRVSAIEGSPEACEDAAANVAGLRQVAVRNWRVTPRAINDAVAVGDLVVLDPPRTGAGRAVIEALAARRARRLVYVSCDAATFARDLRVALDHGFHLREIRAFDLFPMTEHLELVGVLDAGA